MSEKQFHPEMFVDETKPALAVLMPDWENVVAKNVEALMTLRAGGVSSGPWGDATGVGGFNVGAYCGDAAFCVKMNRQLVADLVPTEPKWMHQVHGTNVVDAETAPAEVQADAATAITPNVVCVVQVADCLPVLLAEKNGKGVAAIHCGWKSLAEGIIQKTVTRLNERLGGEHEYLAWLGPRIGDNDFETGEDVLDAMKVHLPEAEKAFKAKGDGKYLASLTALARQALSLVGVQDVIEANHSTYANKELFYSYRRDETTGRHAVMIWFTKPVLL